MRESRITLRSIRATAFGLLAMSRDALCYANGVRMFAARGLGRPKPKRRNGRHKRE